MDNQLKIRLAKHSDINLIANLSRVEIEGGLPWSWTPNKLKRFFSLPSTNAYVAEFNGQFAGFSIASLGDSRAHLVLLAVAPRFRRRGIGMALLNWQVKSAQTAGLTDMSLEVRAANRSAQLFYATVGFLRIRLLPKYYCNQENAVRFRMNPIRSATTDISKRPSQSKKFS